MGNFLADAWRSIGVERSPLLRDFGPEDRSWWRFGLAILMGLLMLVIVSLVIAVIAIIIGIAVAASQGIDPMEIEPLVQRFIAGDFEPTWWSTLGTFAVLGLSNALIMLGLVWVASLMVKKPLKLSFTTARRWRWRQLMAGLVIYGVALGALTLVTLVFFSGGEEVAQMPMVNLSPTVLHMVIYAIAMSLIAIVAAGAEELVFRGWLLRHSANLMRAAWIFLPLNGLLFSAIHVDFDPSAFLARTVMGIGFCWMALRFGGIEFATGAHAANNILILLFIEPLALTPPPPEPFSTAAGGEILLMLVLMVAATELAIRFEPVARLIRGREDAGPAGPLFD